MESNEMGCGHYLYCDVIRLVIGVFDNGVIPCIAKLVMHLTIIACRLAIEQIVIFML